MNLVKFNCVAFLTFFYSSQFLFAQSNEYMEAVACPPDVAKARERIENFIFPRSGRTPRWLDDKHGQTLPELAKITGRFQIELLNDPEHSSVCERINHLHSDELALKYENVDRPQPSFVYDIVYYKVGPFYAVVRVHAPVPQPDDPDLISVTTGYDYIKFYDRDLSLIQGFGI